jgi:septal ring-binding cell division protein DamX
MNQHGGVLDAAANSMLPTSCATLRPDRSNAATARFAGDAQLGAQSLPVPSGASAT